MYNFFTTSTPARLVRRALLWGNSPAGWAVALVVLSALALRVEAKWRVTLVDTETHAMCNEVREHVQAAARLGGTELHRPELEAIAHSVQWEIGRDNSWWPAERAAATRHVVAQAIRKEAREIHERAVERVEAQLGLNEKRVAPDSGPLPRAVAGHTVH